MVGVAGLLETVLDALFAVFPKLQIPSSKLQTGNELLYAAVTRRTLDGKHPGGWFPEQKISVAEAVRCYTVNPAYAEFSENVKGTLTPGKFADLVILDKNIFTVDPVEIENAKVVLTVVDGKVAFEGI